MNILAFGASYHKASINKEFATHVSRYFQHGNDIDILDLNQYSLPLFTVDVEEAEGYPLIIDQFIERLDWADLIIVSFAEHNGAYTAAFKNLFDWTSRVKLEMFEDTQLFMLSTSPGARGAQTVLEIAMDRFPRHGAKIIDHFSLPSFNENYSYKEGIVNDKLRAELEEKVLKIKEKLQ